MNLELTDDQRALVDAVEQILEPYQQPPATGAFIHRAADLEATLRSAGFLDVAREEGYGALEAALIVEAIGKVPAVVEAGASALVAAALTDGPIPAPVSLVADVRRAARFLDVAKSAFVLTGEGAYLLDLEGVPRETVKSIFNYPYGRFLDPPDMTRGRKLTAPETETLMARWRLAIAAEAVGAMQGALDFTIDYVKTRRLFNTTLASYQAVQHRISERTVFVQGARWLVLEAAWRDDPGAAALAASYVQAAIPALTHDCHQFNGALGVTLEHALHYWTYRLTALQAELGGAAAQGVAAADAIWSSPAAA